jgi:TPR repeat protein
MARKRYSRNDPRLLADAEHFEEAGDYKMAAKVLQRGAKLGNPSCQLNLGNYYADGTGVRKSLERAAYWYKAAYRSGDRSGALGLAIDKRNQGDFRSAEAWFKKAVAMKDGSAHLELAKMYLAQGKKRTEALKMLEKVIRMSRDDVSNDEKAEAKLLLRKLKGSSVQKRKTSQGVKAKR